MIIDLDDLEAKARAATPGPWIVWSQQPEVAIMSTEIEVASINTWRSGADEGRIAADQDFIAATNPAVVLELVRRLGAAEGIVRALSARPPNPTIPCPLCYVHPLIEGNTATLHHATWCPYRCAVEAKDV
jgi:hypothetical protein